MDGSVEFCVVGGVNCDEICGKDVGVNGEVDVDINSDAHDEVNVDLNGRKRLWRA